MLTETQPLLDVYIDINADIAISFEDPAKYAGEGTSLRIQDLVEEFITIARNPLTGFIQGQDNEDLAYNLLDVFLKASHSLYVALPED